MAKTSSRKAKKNPDFKRIKAKVGKRAIKPANVTDTTFKTASLQVRKQQVGAEAQTTSTHTDAGDTATTDPAAMAVLYSAKGKSLQELTAQLSHPASNVRISAIKGMNNIVNDFPHVFMSRHYYLLFPAMAKCLVDMDVTARQLSRNLLRDVLRQAQLPLQRSSLRPYIPLLVAYILSALNSLDRPTRMDGAKALIILFEHNNEDGKVGHEGDEDGHSSSMDGLVDDDDLGRLLPALVGFISTDPHQQHPSQSQSQIPKRKSSKKSSAMESERCIVLQSLVSVLRGVSMYFHAQSKQSQSTALAASSATTSRRWNLNLANDSQVNGSSVVLLRRGNLTPSSQRPKSVIKLTCIADLPPFDDQLSGITSNSRYALDDATVMLPTSFTMELVSKLCDHLVETTQAGGQDDLVGMDQVVRRANNMIGKYAAEELNLVVNAISLVWKTLGLRGYQDKEELLKGVKQWRQLVALLLEIFPIVSQEHQSKEDGIPLCDRLNLTICIIMMEVSSTLIEFDEEDEVVLWMDPVLEYLLPQVEKDSEAARHKASVVHLLARLLLLRRGQNGPLLLSPTTHQTILETLQKFLLGSTENNKPLELDENRIRSPAGRRVAQLVRVMVANLCNLDPFISQVDAELNKRLLAMLFETPSFLKAWRGDFPLDSYAMIILLTDVVRRIPPETADNLKQNFLKQTRQGLAQLFTAGLDPTGTFASGKRKRKLGALDGGQSIFEQLPPATQRQLIGLIALLQSPTSDTVTSLGIICARSGMNFDDSSTVSREVDDFIVQVLHSIRRTLSMPSYLGFLIQSIGFLNNHGDFKVPSMDDAEISSDPAQTLVNNMAWSSDDHKLVLLFDRKLQRTSRYLTDCGSASKILPMLYPELSSWLDVSTFATNPKLFTLRARSAISILSWISRDMQISCEESAVFVIVPEFEQLLVMAVSRLMQTLVATKTSKDDNENTRLTASFLRPIIVLLQNEPSLLKLIFSRQLAQKNETASSVSLSGTALETLLLIVRDPLLRETLTRDRQDVLEIAQTLEKEATGGPLESASRSLRTYIEAFR